MPIDPRRLGVLLAIATAGSIKGAAASLHLTPPAVSQQLAQLEREAGTTLADRTRNGLTLTPAGALLADHAAKIASQLQDAERELAELTERPTGEVTVTALQSVLSPLITTTLRHLATEQPGVVPHVVETYGSAALRKLARGEIDVVVDEYDMDLPPSVERGVVRQVLLDDALVIITPRSWGATVPSLVELRDRPWVVGPPSAACYRALERLARNEGFDLSWVKRLSALRWGPGVRRGVPVPRG